MQSIGIFSSLQSYKQRLCCTVQSMYSIYCIEEHCSTLVRLCQCQEAHGALNLSQEYRVHSCCSQVGVGSKPYTSRVLKYTLYFTLALIFITTLCNRIVGHKFTQKDIQFHAKYTGNDKKNGFTQGKIEILVFQGGLRLLYIVVNSSMSN